MIDGTETPWRNPKNEKQQAGIEERAAKHLRDNNLVWSVEGSLPRIVADFAQAETATLTAENNRLKEALRELIEALVAGHFIEADEALAKAHKLLDAQ